MTSGSKQYGLLLPQKGGAKNSSTTRTNVFGDDSDSETEEGVDWVKNAFKRKAGQSVQKHALKSQVKKALEQDPTVFQYDEIYEDLEQSKADAEVAKKGVDKKPRYIQALLQTAERRKREHERQIERQVQKEREDEGTQFADKESFVTASYRAKLEEFKKQEEEEKRMERLEAIGDVTKQKDLTGFYRHIYRQTMGESLPSSKGAETSNSASAVPESDSVEKTADESAEVKKEVAKKDRQYRKRRSSSSSCGSSKSSGKESKDAGSKDVKNIDADSDITSSSSSSSSDSESSAMESGSEEGEITKKKKDKKKSITNEEEPQLKRPKPDAESEVKAQKDNGDSSIKESTEDKNASDTKESEASKQLNIKNESEVAFVVKSEELNVEETPKPKVNIWVKRTVGEAYDDAIRRYFERKAARTAGRA